MASLREILSAKGITIPDSYNEDEEYSLEPLEELPQGKVRITKRTALAIIMALFPTPEELMLRFVEAKRIANLADGERDALRAVVQALEPGQYGRCCMTKKETAEQVYVNADGKYVLERLLLTSVERPKDLEDSEGVIIFKSLASNPAEFLDHILSMPRAEALTWLEQHFIGEGMVIDNTECYSKKAPVRVDIVVLP